MFRRSLWRHVPCAAAGSADLGVLLGITCDSFQQRLMEPGVQVKRVLTINGPVTMTTDVVEAACETLVIDAP